MAEVRELLLRGGGGRRPQPFQVCAASLNDWNRYVRSSSQEMRPKYLDWYDGAIWIVEYPGTLHAAAAAAIMVIMANATGTQSQHLIGYADTHNARPLPGERNLEQDCAFGPSAHVDGTAQRIPRGLKCLREFQTVKVEVGVSQEWLGRGGLNERAAVWKKYPGVEYVLLVKLSPDLLVRQYRLEQRVDGVFPENFAILDIDSSAILHFDAHRREECAQHQQCDADKRLRGRWMRRDNQRLPDECFVGMKGNVNVPSAASRVRNHVDVPSGAYKRERAGA